MAVANGLGQLLELGVVRHVKGLEAFQLRKTIFRQIFETVPAVRTNFKNIYSGDTKTRHINRRFSRSRQLGGLVPVF